MTSCSTIRLQSSAIPTIKIAKFIEYSINKVRYTVETSRREVYAYVTDSFKEAQHRDVILEVLHSNTHDFQNGNNDPFFALSITSNLMRQ